MYNTDKKLIWHVQCIKNTSQKFKQTNEALVDSKRSPRLLLYRTRRTLQATNQWQRRACRDRL